MRLALHDPDYPALLRRTPGPPRLLHVAGDSALLWHPGVAIVGSRSPTAGGRETAHEFARVLAASGLSVISGLAAGIDTAAHEGALAAGGRTIAVVATGVDPELSIADNIIEENKSTSDGASTEYYKFPIGFSDLIDLIEFKNMNFAIGNIFKACYRLGEKAGNDRAYDLRKIIFFAQRELDRISSGKTF